LSWYSQFGAWGKKETKEEADAKPEAPELGADDAVAWNFYWENARAFVREFGLMEMRIAEMSYEGVAKSIFIERLSAIHEMVIGKRAEAAREPAEEKPAVTIEGSENG
jgi:hypothetical protein